MDPVLQTVVFLGFIVVIAVLGIWQRVRSRPLDGGLLSAFAKDPDVVIAVRDGVRQLRTAPLTLPAFARGGRIRQMPVRMHTLVVEVPSLKLATHTTLTLSFEGYAGAYRDQLGLPDIQVGDEPFDKRFTIRGSAGDVVRAVFANGPLKSAITRLFEDNVAVVRFVVDDDGLRVDFGLLRLEAAEMKKLLLAVQAIAVLLDDGIPADAPQRALKQLEARGGDVVAVASDTGSPVVVKR